MGRLTSRERVERALNFLPTDRPVKDLGSTRVTGMTAWTYGRLRKNLGLPERTTRVYDLSQFLAEMDEELLDTLGCDFVMLPLQTLPLELVRSGWKLFRFWDGNDYEVPEHFNPRITSDGALECGHGYPWNNVCRKMVQGCYYFERIESSTGGIEPASGGIRIPHQEESDWSFVKPFSEEFLRAEESAAIRMWNEIDKSIVASATHSGLGLPMGYGDIIGWAMKLLTDPSHAVDYMHKEAEALSKRAEGYIEAVGKYASVFVLSQVDFGTQKSELFNPEIFNNYYLPAWKYTLDKIRKKAPAVKVFIHTCGSVKNLIPYFIETGIHILNPVQFSAENMERKVLADEFGGKIVFWGGGCDTQKLFPFGKLDEIRKDALLAIGTLGKTLGYVHNPGHNIQPDVPVENIIGFYRI